VTNSNTVISHVACGISGVFRNRGYGGARPQEKLEFPEFSRKYFHNTMISLIIQHFLSEPLYPFAHCFRSDPIGFAGGEYLPLPASKGLAFPFLLTSMGTPLLPANFAQRQRGSLKSQETPVKKNIDKNKGLC